MRDFNLEEALAGAKVCTRDGRKVAKVSVDYGYGEHIAVQAEIIGFRGTVHIGSYNTNGRIGYEDEDCPVIKTEHDLMMEE